MYDADEQLRDIKDTAQSTANTVKTGMDLAQRLRQMMQSGAVAEMAVNDPNFVFTGQSTDLRFFAEHDVMSMDMIRNIADPELKSIVQSEFNLAAQQGLIEIEPKQGTISITEKGLKHIQRPEFRAAAQKNLGEVMQEMQLQQQTAVDMGFPLNGSMNDIQFFRFSDSLDLSAVMQSPNQEVAEKVLAGVQKLQSEGKVAIDGLKVTLTEAGKQTLASPMMQAAAGSVNCVPTGEPVSTAIVVAVNAVKTAVQTIGNISSGTAMKL